MVDGIVTKNGYGDVRLVHHNLFSVLIEYTILVAGWRIQVSGEREWGATPRAAGAVSVEAVCR